MLTTAAVMVVLAQATPGAAARAASTARVDCAAGRERTTVWDRARAPEVMRYCDFLAHAEARLPGEPRRAAESAEAAGNLLPGQVAPRILRARAALGMGQPKVALPLLEEALKLDPEALSRDARAQLAMAVSLRDTGATARAVDAYRALVPRIDALPGEERGRARLDAALALTMATPPAMGEAVALLREGAEQGPAALQAVARAVLALVLERTGAREEANAQAEQARRGGAMTALGTPDRGPIGWSAEALAVGAKLREASDPAGAASAWEAYAARAPQGPWAAQAQKRAGELRRGGGGRAKGAK